jgi:hypothetical protein
LRETPKPFTPASQQFAAAAHDLIVAGLSVFLTNPRTKAPLISRENGGAGVYDATRDFELVEAWAWKYPGADLGARIPTGVVVFDVDVARGKQGREQFIRLSGGTAPEDMPTPTAISISGGWHLWFETSDTPLSTCQGIAGAPDIDVKAHPDGYVIAPTPWNGRRWLENKPQRPAPAPQWLINAAASKGPGRDQSGVSRPASAPQPIRHCGVDSRYGRATLEAVVYDIASAGDGNQEAVFSAGALKVARLIASGDLTTDAIEAVRDAAYAMMNFNSRQPWRRSEIDRKIDRQLMRGRANPWAHVDWARELAR